MYFSDIKQIIKKFNNKKNKIFFLNGNDIFLINENKKLIKKFFYNYEYINIKINNNINWDDIFLVCRNNNLYMRKKILFFKFENNIVINKVFKKIFNLFKIFYFNIIIVLIGLYLTNLLKNILINNNVYNSIVNINCKIHTFKNFLIFYTKKFKFKLELNSLNLLFNCFDGNFLELYQFLELLLLIYPDGNINIINIKKIIYNTSLFTFSNFIKNFLIGNINNSLNILKKIRKEKIEPVLLLHIFKNELIILMKIKFNKNNKNLCKDLNTKNIFNYKILLYNKVINRLSYNDFNNFFLVLVKIENLIKTNNNILFWNEIKNLLILICK
ncbi:DNA polymerase III subunit delta [Enterobacteriaceae bacterium ET-AT1-13]|nr:DNA polymerase III subunit delta [Enterobacteriaceae bacterium ET-AT1-13]WGS66465.1 DNA polymerase III subunit delta [Enterobacteriaceae bacterium Cmel17]WMC17490.1 MAG: DNA polymerase III subunit delta [Enterobacteriaceae bacterium Cmel21]WMC17697.1 MAG: DNA polymerase III subunit delta [Enterobacteriaceae bacterium PSmelAO3-2]WMC17901.1 MAG: DNA polymerase III subunit delta [Enterobacteriaceae bacterium PSmelAO3-1]WMC18104.1 MAG: DNA polymerase III subunit delta [Enterobacteriaceae bacter